MEQDETAKNWLWTPRRWGVAVALLMLAFAAQQVLLSVSSRLWDRDEPRFARAAVEMFQSGDYLVPHFNAQLRPDKPPLVYWLMNVGLALLGVSELAVRLPSIVGMTACVGLTAWLGRRLFDRDVGWWAGVMFATSVMPIYMGSGATADGTLLPGILGALLVVTNIWLRRQVRWSDYAWLTLALSWAQLAKGPVGLAVPVLAVIGISLWWRWERHCGSVETDAAAVGQERTWPRGLLPVLAVAVVLSVGAFLAWGIPADRATGGELARIGLGRHVVDRVVNAQEGHGGGAWWSYLATLPLYLPVLAVGIFPWGVFLLAGVAGVFRRRFAAARQRAALVGLTLPTLLMMSLVATKLPHYILPMLPGMSVLLAAVLVSWRRGALPPTDERWLLSGGWLVAPGAVGLIGFVVAVPVIVGGSPWRWLALLAGLPMLRLLVGNGRWFKQGTYGRLAWSYAVAMPLTLVLLALLVMPALERLKISAPLAAVVQAQRSAGMPVYAIGYQEPSLVFYLNLPAGERLEGLASDAASLRQWAQQGPDSVLVIRDSAWPEQLAQQEGWPVSVVERVGLFNYASGELGGQVLVVVRKQAAPAPGM